MLRSFTAAVVFAVLLSSCAEKSYEIAERRVPVAIGDDVVEVVIHQSENPGLTYVNLHDDENTAVEAALAILREHGGRLIELQHTGERNVAFSLRDTSYAFDPNRMFTAVGVDTTLSRQSILTEAAHAAVTNFADSVLSLIAFDELSTIITVHNNTDERYSARSYMEEGPYARDARFVHIAAGSDADDFFFVTTQELYDDLRDAGFNVVMQDNAVVTDDGSLSVLAGQTGIPYVNAEAQHGHFEEQQRMLAHLDEYLADL